MTMDNYDVVIVGTGVAGLYGALSLPRDLKILMITKDVAENSDSFLAQGGICVQLNDEDYDGYFEIINALLNKEIEYAFLPENYSEIYRAGSSEEEVQDLNFKVLYTFYLDFCYFFCNNTVYEKSKFFCEVL